MPLEQKFSKADKGRKRGKKAATEARGLKPFFKRGSEGVEREVQQAFEKWIAAVSTGSADAVTALYAPEAVLLPTLSPKVHDTHEQRSRYFNEFTSRKNLKGEVNESYIRVFGDTAVNSGMYTFTFSHDDDTPQAVPARFSFVYRRTNDGWMIIDHHSSAAPTAQGHDLHVPFTTQNNQPLEAGAEKPGMKTGKLF